MSAAEAPHGAEIAKLIERHYVALGSDAFKDSDFHWAISERWSYARYVGWVVEHDGYSYHGLADGEDGPFPTRVEAEVVLIEHLHAAIAEAEAEPA